MTTQHFQEPLVCAVFWPFGNQMISQKSDIKIWNFQGPFVVLNFGGIDRKWCERTLPKIPGAIQNPSRWWFPKNFWSIFAPKDGKMIQFD